MRIAKALPAVSMFLGAAYLLAPASLPHPASIALKGSMAATLALWAILNRAPLLAVGLIFSTLGDVLLELDHGRLFVQGLAAFLCAHLVYLLLFLRNRGRVPAMGATAMVLYSGTMGIWLAPSLGAFRLPVFAYLVAITAMTIAAFGSRFVPLAAIGALLFTASDSLIAIAKFKGTFPGRDTLVWSTYCAAQLLISKGVLR
jgi:uncharacterized membrane protein YhhN